MRVAIVGGAGFIGCSLAQYLHERGIGVRVLDSARRLGRIRGQLHGAETCSFDFPEGGDAMPLLENVDALVHLACSTNPARSMENMALDAESNIVPSLRLFDSAVAAGISRVVFSSSGGTVYGIPQRLPLDESHATRPLSAYGVMKLAIENYLDLYPSLNGISLRIANPYGAYQLQGAAVGVIARYVDSISRGESIEVWGDGTVVRDYIAIEDVAEAFYLALTLPGFPRGVYNVGSGVAASINDIIETVFDVSGRNVPVRYASSRSYDVPSVVLDNSSFSSVASWTPAIPLRKGIENLWHCAAGRGN